MSDTPVFDALSSPQVGPLNATKKPAPPALADGFGLEEEPSDA